MTTTRHCRCGVTLIELTVVSGILLLLAVLLLPAIAKAQQAADRAQSINHLKMLGIAIHNFHDTNGRLPPVVGQVGVAEGSLLYHLLPYLDQANLYKSARSSDGKFSSWIVSGTVIPEYVDPDDKSLSTHVYQNAIATTNYAGNWLGFKDGTNRFPAAFQDGTSNTMAFATRYQLCNGTPTAWAYPAISTWTPMFGYYSHAKFQVNPRQDDCDPHVPQAIGPVMIVAMFDGSARSLNENISPLTWRAATTPAGGEILGNDW